MDDSNAKKSWIEKYRDALKFLIPVRYSKDRDKNVLPNNNVGLFSYMTANWMNNIMWDASRRTLNPEEIKEIGNSDGVKENSERLTRIWEEELRRFGPDQASLQRTIWRFNRCRLIMAAIMLLVASISEYIGTAWIIEYLLYFLSDSNNSLWHGLALVIALAASRLVRNLAFSAFWIMGVMAGARVTGALQVMIYEKVLRIKNGGEKLVADVVNYSSSDTERIFMNTRLIMLVVAPPVMSMINVVYCYQLMGPWSLIGNAIILISYPSLTLVGNVISKFLTSIRRTTVQRLSVTNQVLASIKQIKTYAWEEAFLSKIKEIRHNEVQVIRKATFLQSVMWTASLIVTTLAPITSIIGFVVWGNTLTTVQTFAVISAYSVMICILYTVPYAVRSFSEDIVSCDKMQKFFLAPDAHQPRHQNTTNNVYSISIKNANISWEDLYLDSTDKKIDISMSLSQEILTDINLIVKKSQLVGISGSVGSGKSTLLAAILGNADVNKGNVYVNGSIAIVSQQAWIFNGTIQENITFGLPYDDQRYKSVLIACSLEVDLELFSNGDKTEIGERGVTLSGGQKQRINLARAAYSNRDIYLLDDVLSAVDVNVANAVFENCIKLFLREKTVILVTHNVQVLRHCDYIIFLKDSRIFEQGTHDSLINQGQQYSEMSNKEKTETDQINDDNELKFTRKSSKNILCKNVDGSSDATLIKAEVDNSTSLTWKSWLYFCKLSGGYCISLLVLLTVILFNVAIMFNIIWLQVWLDTGTGINKNSMYFSYKTSALFMDANEESLDMATNLKLNPKLYIHITVLGVSAVVIIIFGIIKGFAFGSFMLTGTKALHQIMFWKVIRSPMSFFETTPLGRIIDRFSKDIDESDNWIPYYFELTLQIVMLILFQLILVGVLYPFYFLVICIFTAIFIAFDIFFTSGVRSLKKVENLLRPPLLIHLATTIYGLATIKCYNKQDMFAEKFRRCVDKQLSAYTQYHLSTKWMAFRSDTIGWFALTGTALAIVLSRDTTTPALAGLAMVQMFRICGVTALITRFRTELSAKLISIERITYYCNNLPEEAPLVINGNRPPQEWPSDGALSFRNVELRYRPDMPLILKSITFDIKAGKKVGIIGRTGAGKSSVFAALLRITEICGGSIFIDGIDISKIGLRDLRAKIAVIPQDPILFEGTIRWNLDPFQEFTDDQIWEALDKVNLKDKIMKDIRGLNSIIDADGRWFSFGEKQLFCLSRALLKNSKILLMDEATASVDTVTDQIIQETIRNAFSHCTVFTIAHRLSTISDYDKIMTIDAGKIVEFDSPIRLMKIDSAYRKMMENMDG